MNNDDRKLSELGDEHLSEDQIAQARQELEDLNRQETQVKIHPTIRTRLLNPIKKPPIELVVGLMILIVAGLLALILTRDFGDINSFEDCVDAGHPVVVVNEEGLRQCIVPGDGRFTER